MSSGGNQIDFVGIVLGGCVYAHGMSKTTLIVGGGLAGLTAAKTVAQAGDAGRITVLDKGRRPGGRMSTRISRSGPTFDHGAQYLTAKSMSFNQQVNRWTRAGVVAEWGGRIVDLVEGEPPRDTKRQATRYVGTPGMGSIIEHLADPSRRDADKQVVDGPHFGVRVTSLKKTDAGWTATDEADQTHGPFHRVILAIPMPQARKLLADVEPDLAMQIGEAKVSATWTLMLAFEKPLELWQPFAGGFVEGEGQDLSWIANNSSKPGRPNLAEAGECWVIHGGAAWSEAHLEDAAESVAATLTAAFGRAIGRTLPSPIYAATHRWRFAHAVEPLDASWLLNEAGDLGVCGDACSAGSTANIERAWLSGLALAERMADA